MQCDQCKNDVSKHLVICAHCEAFLGYPNVRAAQEPDEKKNWINDIDGPATM